MASEFTVADMVNETKFLLEGTTRELINVLNATITNVQTTLVTTNATDGITVGSYIDIDDEIMYVTAVNTTTKTLTVLRGQRGSIGAAHTAGALIGVNPRFPRFAIKRAIKAEIRSWPPNVFFPASLNVASASSTRSYDLTGETGTVYRLLKVQLSPESTDISTDSWPTFGARLDQGMPVAQFPSGKAVVLSDFVDLGRTVRITYAKPFVLTTFADATTIDVIGLRDSMFDIPPMGAAWRLMAGRETRRVREDVQGTPRNAEEIPVRAVAAASEDLRRIRNTRLSDEALRLLEEFPWRD